MTELFEFRKFDKIPRLRRSVIITEKIDGTNAQISIADRREVPQKYLEFDQQSGLHFPFMSVTQDGVDYLMLAGSRKRWLTNDKQGDNYGFGRWVSDNRDELLSLGVGRHYGEWWGAGIQRRYDMDRKVFSLFNTARWGEHNLPPECCAVVPVLRTGMMDTDFIEDALSDLALNGSKAAPGFMKPEGIVIYMAQARRLFKITLENDGVPKSKVKADANLRTSAEWIQDFPVTLHDPDGWDRRNFQYSFYKELITLAEFKYRVGQSTVEGICS
jgi:hypothetical protein